MPTPASQFQRKIAGFLGIAIDDSSFAIAAAQIESAISEAIYPKYTPALPATEKQVVFAADLGLNVSQDNMKVASARIQEALDQRNATLIRDMQITPGTRVKWRKWNQVKTISSISANGRLWFKGGNGSGAFPHEIELAD